MANPKLKEPTGAAINRDSLPYVTGTLGFGGTPGVTDFAPYECRFHDARPIVNELSLDREGFTLIRYENALARQGNVDQLRREYLAYLEDLAPVIKAAVGASWIVPRTAGGTGVVVRSATKMTPDYVRDFGGIEIPYNNVHMDYTAVASRQFAKAENLLRKFPERPFSRMTIIQSWQAVSKPPQDRPLALMDASTLDQKDVYQSGADPDPEDYSGKILQSRNVSFNPKQRWYYFPNMVHNEVILFKGYDSANLTAPPTAPHASFLDTAVGGRSHPRESIEARFFCYYE